LHTLICKGAVDEVLSQCTRVNIKGAITAVQAETRRQTPGNSGRSEWSRFRVIAVAYKEMPGSSNEPVYGVKDESDLILLGFLAFPRPAQGHRTRSFEAAFRPGA